jgi:hypothetical protein
VAPGTPTVGALVGPTVPGVDFRTVYADQMRPDEDACAAAMTAGMDARTNMLAHYGHQLDAAVSGTAAPVMGDLMVFPPIGEDPSAGVGNTLPTAAFYEPPRGYGGAGGAPGYGGEQGIPQ